MNVLLWIVFGGLAGWVATLLTGDDAGFGIFGNIVVGIIGAFIGGWIADRVGMGGAPGTERPTSIGSFITAVLGAVILLWIVGLVL